MLRSKVSWEVKCSMQGAKCVHQLSYHGIEMICIEYVFDLFAKLIFAPRKTLLPGALLPGTLYSLEHFTSWNVLIS